MDPYETPSSDPSYLPPLGEQRDNPAFACSANGIFYFTQAFISPKVCIITGEKLAENPKPSKLNLTQFAGWRFEIIRNAFVVAIVLVTSILKEFTLIQFSSIASVMILFVVLTSFSTFLFGSVNVYYSEKIKNHNHKLSVFLPAAFFLLIGIITQSIIVCYLAIFIPMMIQVFIRNTHQLQPDGRNGDYYVLHGAHPDFLAYFPEGPLLSSSL